ncbi:MAG: hypothetical protein ACI97K_000693 [Glaciecola sp.]|jgi:hypothetical protein
MMHLSTIESWFKELGSCNLETTQILIGYGSLLGKDNRDRYSNIRSEPLPLLVAIYILALKAL